MRSAYFRFLRTNCGYGAALLFGLAPGTLWAQGAALRGRVLSQERGEPLIGAVVLVAPASDSASVQGTVTDTGGYFAVSNLPPRTYRIRTSYTGYERLSHTVNVGEHDVTVGPLYLQPQAASLYAVVVEAVAARAQQRGDTLEFDASSYKTHPDATTEDLIAKMPGVSTDNGAVKVNGVEVKRILIDGKPFFGDDLKAALRNLPADIIRKVQVLDQQSDQARFTGFREGAGDKTINLVTRDGKNLGAFGWLQAGYGSDKRYNANTSVNFFKDSRRISVSGSSNNINLQNFSVDDPTGSATAGAGMSGTTTNQSAGLNYSEEWGPKLRATGSYAYSQSDNTTNTSLTRWYLTPAATQDILTYRENSFSQTTTANHRANLRLEYAPNATNEFIFTPRLSVQSSHSLRRQRGSSSWDNGLTDSRSETGSTAGNDGWNAGSELLYRQRFRKAGRSLSLSVSNTFNGSHNTGDLATRNERAQRDTSFNSQRSTQETAGTNVSLNVSYTEPLTPRSQLLVTYQPSSSRTGVDRYVYNRTSDGRDSFLNPGLTNLYQNEYRAHRGGLGYRYSDSLWDFNATLKVQAAQLEGAQAAPDAFSVTRSFRNFLPQAQVLYRLAPSATLSAGYTTSTGTPQISQLQNGVSTSNPLMLRMGNPDLRQDYTHSAMLSYSRTQAKTGRSLFLTASAALIQNYIASTTYTALADTVIAGVVLLRGSQISRPINLDGAWNARGNAAVSLPLRALKSNLNLTSGLSLNRMPGIVNGQRNNADNYSLSLGWVLGSNTRNGLDITASMQSAYTLTRNSLPGQFTTAYYNQNTSLRLNWIFGSRVVFNTSVVNTWYAGLGSGYDRLYTLWNASLGYKLLKSRALQADVFVFDILRQANSIARKTTDSYIEDSEVPVLQQYILGRLTSRIRPKQTGNR